MTTPNTQVISVANTIITNAQSLIQIYNSQNQIDLQWTDDSVATYLAAFNTAALNADGTQSSTQDGTPNSAHPIQASAYPPLSRPLTATQITQMKTIIDAVVSLLNGNAVSAQTGARAILDAAVGG
jgi:hypothetical protein